MSAKKNKNQSRKSRRVRIRTVMTAPHINNSKLFHWGKDNKHYCYSDKCLIRMSKEFSPKSSRFAKAGTSLHEIYRYYQHYYFGNGKPKHTFKTADYIFSKKRKWSNVDKCRAIGNHMIFRLLVFHAMDSAIKQNQQQKRLPKNKRRIKLPDTPHIAFILHDKDKDLKPNQSVGMVSPHCQTSIHFKEPIKIRQVAHWLGLAQHNIQKGQQNSKSEENAMAYLTHIKEPWDKSTYLKKHHYNYKDVVSDTPWFKYRDLRKRCLPRWRAYRGKLIKEHYDMSLSELNNKLMRGELTKAQIFSNDTLFRIYCSKFKNDTDRIMKAVQDRKGVVHDAKFRKDWKAQKFHRTYVLCCGEGRSGKSFIAQHAVDLAGKRLHMSTVKLNGKKGDLFQQYNGEDLAVLDEVRKKDFDFQDFVQAGDQVNLRKLFGDVNWTTRGAVITEPFLPAKFLYKLGGRDQEDMDQAIGRLDLVIQTVKERDKDGRVIFVKGSNGKMQPKRMAEIYYIKQKPTVYFYHVDKNRSFKSSMVLYPNPHLNYCLGKYALVTPKRAIKILADKICRDNDPKLNHEGNDRPYISDKNYQKPTPQELKRIKRGVSKGDDEAIAVKHRLDNYQNKKAAKVLKGVNKIKQKRELKEANKKYKEKHGGVLNHKKINIDDPNLPF